MITACNSSDWATEKLKQQHCKIKTAAASRVSFLASIYLRWMSSCDRRNYIDSRPDLENVSCDGRVMYGFCHSGSRLCTEYITGKCDGANLGALSQDSSEAQHDQKIDRSAVDIMAREDVSWFELSERKVNLCEAIGADTSGCGVTRLTK